MIIQYKQLNYFLWSLSVQKAALKPFLHKREKKIKPPDVILFPQPETRPCANQPLEGSGPQAPTPHEKSEHFGRFQALCLTRTCIEHGLDAVLDVLAAALCHQVRCAVGRGHHQRPHQEGGGRAQVVEQGGDGRGRGALVRGEPGGGEERSRVHHRGPRQAIQQLPAVDQPARESTPR